LRERFVFPAVDTAKSKDVPLGLPCTAPVLDPTSYPILGAGARPLGINQQKMHKQDAAEGEDDPPRKHVGDHSGEGRDAPVAAYPSRGVKPEEYDKEKQPAECDPLVPVRVHDVLQKAGTRFLRSTARKAVSG